MPEKEILWNKWLSETLIQEIATDERHPVPLFAEVDGVLDMSAEAKRYKRGKNDGDYL